MKKRILSLLLAAVMLTSLSVPVSAAQSADDRLAAVTAQVKKTLGLDTGAYTEFYGDLMEDILAPSWYLEWSGENGSMNISATEDGKVLSFRVYENDLISSEYSIVFAPSFPAGDQQSAQKAAREFLDKVLGKGESVTMEARDAGLDATVYRFSGEILLNGLSAGMSYSISVRCEDNVVTAFSRDDLNGYIMGDIPSASAKIKAAQAGSALRDTLALRLEYVLPEDGGSRAVLRYLPEYGDEYYVDALTGELVNLTELAQSVEKGDMESATGGASSDTALEAPAEAEDSLSKAEQQGADKLKGVLDREALDVEVREITALGLESYTLSSVSYTVARESDGQDDEADVTAVLLYGRQVNGRSWRRTVTVDAKTGALIRVYSSAGMPEDAVERTVDQAAARNIAAEFLKAQCGDAFAETELYDSYDALEHDRRVSHSFTFAQKENGYFFPSNSLSVGVDATDGSISAYEKRFDSSVTFEDASGILTMDQALDARLNTYDVKLAYILVPTAIDYSQREYQPLMDYGISYLYKLVLGYSLEQEDYLLGIDAKTGQPVKPGWAEEVEGMTYSDISGHWAENQIKKLAQYGVGYLGGAFQPNAALTQLDLIALLASAEGYQYDGIGEAAADNLYEYAYRLGILSKEERKDEAVMTRIQTIRLILNAMGYGPVAQLEGIYRTRFADDGSIPQESYGYAALAQGLGMVNGDPANRLLPNDNATRAQAAVMLYNLMAR